MRTAKHQHTTFVLESRYIARAKGAGDDTRSDFPALKQEPVKDDNGYEYQRYEDPLIVRSWLVCWHGCPGWSNFGHDIKLRVEFTPISRTEQHARFTTLLRACHAVTLSTAYFCDQRIKDRPMTLSFACAMLDTMKDHAYV